MKRPKPSRKSGAKSKGSRPPMRKAKSIKQLKPQTDAPAVSDGKIRLNKYLSQAGICSRREADVLIATGIVSVNGEIITELGYKISPGDVVKYDGSTIKSEKNRYVLLNKPKNYSINLEETANRSSVLSLVQDACKEMIYPVGKMDKQTMGLLLLTNDSDLTKKLTNPNHAVERLFNVALADNVKTRHLHMIRHGFELEEKTIKADEVDYVGEGQDHRKVGLRIHTSKDRVVRDIFEHFGYNIVKLDRVMYAGLTKKDLPRGRYRHLTEKEVAFLKMLG